MLNNPEDELDDIERRDERRNSLLVRATIHGAGTPVAAYVVDISRTGLGMQCPVCLVRGQVVQIEVTLECLGERKALRLPAVVRNSWAQTERHHRVGVQFTELSPDALAFLHRLCP